MSCRTICASCRRHRAGVGRAYMRASASPNAIETEYHRARDDRRHVGCEGCGHLRRRHPGAACHARTADEINQKVRERPSWRIYEYVIGTKLLHPLPRRHRCPRRGQHDAWRPACQRRPACRRSPPAIGAPGHGDTPAQQRHGAERVLVRDCTRSALPGDVFGSQRCDCGDQLAAAMAMIAAEGRIVLLTCAATSRGIRLVASFALTSCRMAAPTPWTRTPNSACRLMRASTARAQMSADLGPLAAAAGF